MPILELGEKQMHEGTWMGSWNSPSDNRKSKTCTESCRSIQNRKLVGIVAIVTTIAICGAVVQAQQPGKIPRIGFLPSGAGDANNPGIQVKAFRQGLRDLGYIEGKNILIEYRYSRGKGGPHPQPRGRTRATQGRCACRWNFAGTIQEAKQATKTIPIVMVTTAGSSRDAGYVE